MPYKVQTGVIGRAIRPTIADRHRSLEEILYDTTQLAMADAGIAIENIDGIIVGTYDQFDGRAITVMMASGAGTRIFAASSSSRTCWRHATSRGRSS